jgi:hypothetical protein
MKFRINKYSQVSNKVGTDYKELTKSIILDKYVDVIAVKYNF